MVATSSVVIAYLGVLYLVSVTIAQDQDPAPQCTEVRRGVPACNFNIGKCFKEPNNQEPAWVHVNPDKDKNKPVNPYSKGYVYLDPTISQGERRKIKAQISKTIKAICVDFRYATTGNSSIPIHVMIQEGDYYHIAHKVMADTGGEWESTSFYCCLPEQEKTEFAIETKSTTDGIPAIDDVDIRHSDMPCENGKLRCYPSPHRQLPLDPTGVKQCPSDQVESAVASCEFKSDDQKVLENCGWEVSPAWEPRQKVDGSGQYDVISSTNGDNATLTSDISDDAESFCIDVQFTAPDIQGDLRNAFSINIITGNDTLLWGESHSYTNKDNSVWKINSFQGSLPQGTSRKIQIVSLKEGLQVDFIHIRIKDVFKCPQTSESALVAPLCGMEANPPEVPGSEQGWIEAEPDNSTEGIFPGRMHYLLYSGSELNLNKTPVTLTTPVMKINSRSLISFSYAISGNARVEVLTMGETESKVYVWGEGAHTWRHWQVFEGPVGQTGNIQVSFRILPPENPTNNTVNVAFTDITIRIEPQTPDPKPTEIDDKPNTKPSDEDTDSGSNAENKGDKSGGSNSNTGVIVGSIFGVLAVVALIGAGLWFFYFRDRDDSEELQGEYVEKMEDGGKEPQHFTNVAYSAGK